MAHRMDESDVFWDEEAGIMIKWTLFWLNKAVAAYDEDYEGIALTGNGNWSVTSLL